MCIRGIRWGARLDRWYHRRLLSAAVSNSRGLADHIAASYGEQRVEVIENGKNLKSLLDIDRAPFAGLEHRAPVVSSLGMLRPVKRHDLLVEAAALLALQGHRINFRVGGEGPCRQSLEALIVQHGLQDTFQLEGLVQNVPRFLADSDIAVICSDSEGLSNSLIESMAAGRTVVATAVGGNAELVRAGENGVLIPPNDSTALAAALARLVANPYEARRLSEEARATVRSRFDYRMVAAEHSRLYGTLLTR